MLFIAITGLITVMAQAQTNSQNESNIPQQEQAVPASPNTPVATPVVPATQGAANKSYCQPGVKKSCCSKGKGKACCKKDKAKGNQPEEGKNNDPN